MEQNGNDLFANFSRNLISNSVDFTSVTHMFAITVEGGPRK